MTSQWKLSGIGLGIPRLMRFVSKWVNTSNEEPVGESDNQRASVMTEEPMAESDAESIAESSALSSLSESPDTSEQGIKFPKMNKHGIYRPKGVVMTSYDGSKLWRENNDEPWSKCLLVR